MRPGSDKAPPVEASLPPLEQLRAGGSGLLQAHPRVTFFFVPFIQIHLMWIQGESLQTPIGLWLAPGRFWAFPVLDSSDPGLWPQPLMLQGRVWVRWCPTQGHDGFLTGRGSTGIALDRFWFHEYRNRVGPSLGLRS